MAYKVAKKVIQIDKKLVTFFARSNPQNFARIWVSRHDFTKHLKKRLRNRDIESLEEYFHHAKRAIEEPRMLYYIKNRRAKLLYIGKEWVDIVLDNARLITSFKRKEPVESILKKEKLHKYAIENIDIQTLQKLRKKYSNKRITHAI